MNLRTFMRQVAVFCKKEHKCVAFNTTKNCKFLLIWKEEISSRLLNTVFQMILYVRRNMEWKKK